MKQIYLLRIVFILCGLHASHIVAQTSGGPDNYGYSWKNSNDANGPLFNWIDITSTGTQVTGLADDNSVSAINMGINFDYYGVEYTAITIGSNGWIGFNNTSNIANCFPILPTMGGVNNFISPFLADLNLTGTGNIGAVYYEQYQTNKFIISFINIPFWFNNANGFLGDNTFQVILDSTDNSITFQYLNMDDTFLGTSSGCSGNFVDSEVGFENSDGSDGLLIIGNEIMPADNLSIRIEDSNTLGRTSHLLTIDAIVCYPNPVKDQLEILIQEEATYVLVNSRGQQLQKGVLHQGKNTLNMSMTVIGVYFLKVVSASGFSTKKIIKQ